MLTTLAGCSPPREVLALCNPTESADPCPHKVRLEELLLLRAPGGQVTTRRVRTLDWARPGGRTGRLWAAVSRNPSTTDRLGWGAGLGKVGPTLSPCRGEPGCCPEHQGRVAGLRVDCPPTREKSQGGTGRSVPEGPQSP